MVIARNSESCQLTELGATFISYNMTGWKISGNVFNFTEKLSNVMKGILLGDKTGFMLSVWYLLQKAR